MVFQGTSIAKKPYIFVIVQERGTPSLGPIMGSVVRVRDALVRDSLDAFKCFVSFRARHYIFCFVLVQPRKTGNLPSITEKICFITVLGLSCPCLLK